MKMHLPNIFFGLSFALALGGCREEIPLFSLMPPQETGVDFANQVVEDDQLNINEYLYAFNGGGVAIGDVNNDGLADIYFSANQTPNQLYLNQGDFTFENITEQAGVAGFYGRDYWTTGISMVDINHDGWLDIYVNQVAIFNQFEGQNQLYINNRDGTFSDQAKAYGLDFKTYAQQSVFFDYDSDGDLDMYLLNHSQHALDVYVQVEKRLTRDSLAGDRLLRNDGDRFVDVSDQAGIYGSALGYGLAVGVADLDNNGCIDIYVSNDFHENDYAYLNQCDGTFQECIGEITSYNSTFSMGNDLADINNDGLLDIFTLDMKPADELTRKNSAGADPYGIYNYKLSFGYHFQYPRNMLHINQGGHSPFSEVGQLANLDATDWSWSVLLADFDNDAFKDVYITNGIARRPNNLDYINFSYDIGAKKQLSAYQLSLLMPKGNIPNYAFRNKGSLEFEDVSAAWNLGEVGCSMGAAYGDLDNDGDLDLVVNNLNADCSVYRNNANGLNGNNFLRIKLQAFAKNPFGFGSRVDIWAGNQHQTQELNPVRGWLSSSEPIIHFGLGREKLVDKILVRWPDGTISETQNIKANQEILIKYSETQQAFPVKNRRQQSIFKGSSVPGLTFAHQENDFNDFDIEPLMLRKLSTQGPALAIADVNGDRQEDLFVGGAAGQAGVLFLQQFTNGRYSFEKMDIPAFAEDRDKEDVDAVFFDADQDGFPDLYVVGGAGQSINGIENQDRLYLNRGYGNFQRSDDLPLMNGNGGCVVSADFDGDGRQDVLVGNRSIPGHYGLSPDSYLLWNKGGGRFDLDTSTYTRVLENLGMVTDAVWHEEKKALIVVGEWMPVTLLKFGASEIERQNLPQTEGWWNRIQAADIDRDGDLDFILGNLGKNSLLKTSVEEPVRIRIIDWDKNGKKEPLMSHYRQGKESIFHGLDELKTQIPKIKQLFNTYQLYAHHRIEDVFLAADLEEALVKEVVTFQSSLLLDNNDHWELRALPDDVQVSPIYGILADDFDANGNIDVLLTGNFYENVPLIGRMGASNGHLLSFDGSAEMAIIPQATSGLALTGQVRRLRIIKVGKEKSVLLTRNNGQLQLLTCSSSEKGGIQEGSMIPQ